MLIVYLIYDLHITDVIIPDVFVPLAQLPITIIHENYVVINTCEILAYSQHITVVA